MIENKFNEYMKCRDDVAYFIEKYVIQKDDTQHVLTDVQKQLIELYSNRNKIEEDNFPRQSGTTVGLIGILLHKALFNDQTTSVYIGYKHSISDYVRKDLLNILSFNIPKYFYSSFDAKPYGIIKLENGSYIRFSGTNSDSLRGIGMSLLILDNLKRKTMTEFKDNLYPCVISSSNGKILAINTYE